MPIAVPAPAGARRTRPEPGPRRGAHGTVTKTRAAARAQEGRARKPAVTGTIRRRAQPRPAARGQIAHGIVHIHEAAVAHQSTPQLPVPLSAE